ncbi:MAG: hypothetical protein J6Y36_09780 [Treponema sp.]|uniref:hypothetical protein n=1 Tax=Treponema sp. TaxID=166 RepID=UPI001B7272F5|nr:hypothetical protein [Treponema sp.]MBP5403433.1 hypothetical protein [Treponema sp.]MBR5933532.1 hypothetical protein [Treponema sp.]
MKNFFCKFVFFSVCSVFTFNCLFAEEPEVNLTDNIEQNEHVDLLEEETMFDDIDSVFSQEEDTEPVITQENPEQTSIPAERKGIILSGDLMARLGGAVYYPAEASPGAVFESKVSFISKPTDFFSFKGTILVKFPEMELGLYELYINYALWDVAYLMVGKKELTWGNAKIFDTNILDDRSDDVFDPEELLYDKKMKMQNSKFAVSLDIPFSKFNFTGLVYYEEFDKTSNAYQDVNASMGNLAYAAKLEANIWNFAMDVFFRTWATNDPNAYPIAVGGDINFQIRDFHIYAQYFTHFEMNDKDEMTYPRQKVTASVWWATREKVNLGFVFEYQAILDWYGLDKPVTTGDYLRQYLTFEGVWGRIGGSKCTAALKWFHDVSEEYGTIIPGCKIHGFVPCADLDIGFPIYYGSKSKVGVVAQLKLSVAF